MVNIYESDYKHIHFIASAVRFQRGSAHTHFWLAVIFDWFCHVWTPKLLVAGIRDGRYLLFYFRYDTDIFKPSIVDTDTSKHNWPLELLKYNP